MIKKILISLIALSLGIVTAKPYLIIWDLGDTLVYVSLFGMVTEIGLPDCALYHIFHTKKKNQLQNLLFDVLEEYGGKQTCPPDQKSYHTAHRPLPQVMCDWLAGKILEPKKLVKELQGKTRELYAAGYFRNNLEYRIVKSAFAAMFNPAVLVKNTKILKEALEIVQEIAYQGVHQQTILSNWDGVSYTNFKNSPTGQELSRYFNMDEVIISGSLNFIKPQLAIFEECINRYGFSPENCILIDDQKENIDAARSFGLKAIQIKHYDFKKLRKELTALGVL